MPKLLILCQMFYPELISTGQTMTELAEELKKFDFDIEVWCGPPTLSDRSSVPKQLIHRGIRITRLWGTAFPKLNFFGKLLNQLTFTLSVFFKLIFEKRKILVVTNPPMMGFFCALLKKNFVYLVFDVYPESAVQAGILSQKSLLAALWRRASEFTYGRANRIIVLGRCMKHRVGHDANVIHVWSDDALIQAAKKDDNPFYSRWNLSGKFVALYSGNMARFHDMETIMNAAEKLPDVLFLFVGDGHKKKAMMQRHLNNCRFYDYVPKEELGHLLQVADVGLVSLMEGQEGYSVPSKTYGIMAAGKPVVAIVPDASEIALMIREEQCGIVVKPGDVLGLLKAIKTSDPKMGENGRRAIRGKYNLHNAAEHYATLLR